MNRWSQAWIAVGGVTMNLAAAAGPALEGAWGGDRLRLVVDAQGATVQADCADGRIAGPIVLSQGGSFVASGTYAEHKGGPQVADEASGPAQARFSGELRGDTLTLSILPAGAKVAQTFRLQRGATVKLVRCL